MAASLPLIKNNNHFFRIRKVLSNQSAKSNRLSDIFSAINAFSYLTLNTADMKNILLEDLKVPALNLRQPLLNVLEEAVLYYCKVWEGWDKPVGQYKTAQDIQVAFTQFHGFVSEKLNFLIKHAEHYIKEMKEQAVAESEQAARTDSSCPYKIVIGGLPSILNTMVVVLKNDDIIIKQYDEQLWTNISIQELLNWPFISVEVKLLDLHIKRVNSHNFQRFISGANQKLPSPQSSFISKVTSLGKNGKPFTHTFFCFYFIQLFNVLQKITGVNEPRIKELQAIYTQFLDDVKEMNIAHGSMCTETNVQFHIGSQNYVRSKQMLVANKEGNKDDIGGVNFVEYILPQIDLSLIYCMATQDMDDKNSVSFKRLNNVSKRAFLTDDQDIKNLAFLVNSTCIEYSCTFCSLKYSGDQALKEIMNHFAQEHKVGHAVICVKCRKQFTIKRLAGSRWKHDCV